MDLMSNLELALYHPIMDQHDIIVASQKKIVDKRGGNLAAPVPRGDIGQCGYINDLPDEKLRRALAEYKVICAGYPRGGLGIDVHCTDVGLEPAGTIGIDGNSASSDAAAVAVENKKSINLEGHANSGSNLSYGDWIEKMQQKRTNAHAERLSGAAGSSAVGNGVAFKNLDQPPPFGDDTLFHDKVELYATSFTTPGTADVQRLASVTEREQLFMPCMVGQLEGQFLKMMAQMMNAKRVLDVGTFTGYSALSFAEGIPEDGKVVTIENDEKIAHVARGIFTASKQAKKLDLVVGGAIEAMETMKKNGETFDIIFLDADKETYVKYYELAMDGMLNNGGVIIADNSLCALVYRNGDMRRDALHDFNKHVAADPRVEQAVLTVREGITMIRPTAAYWEGLTSASS
jgi:predicted O-methyltransferase YrrM